MDGDLGGNFFALDARDGKTLQLQHRWSHRRGVVTYEQNGKQYVALASGSSGGSIPLTGSTTMINFGH
jgi:hypothetical protein